MASVSAPLTILYQDDRLLVVDKPAGMLSVPAPGDARDDRPALPRALAQQGLHAIPVHRLDRDVSGAVLFALDKETRALLEAVFRARSIRKTYWALVQGRPQPAIGTLHFPILEEGAFARVSALGKKSITHYRTLESLSTMTALEIELVTGRYNQIRVHFAHAGYPLVGERKYARGKDTPVRIKSRRVALHAWRLEFPHPHTGAKIEVEAPLAQDLEELLNGARGR